MSHTLVSKTLLIPPKVVNAMRDIIEIICNVNLVYQVVKNARMVLHALNVKLQHLLQQTQQD